jgi:hypothetical protein
MARAAGGSSGLDKHDNHRRGWRSRAALLAVLTLGLAASPVARAAIDELKFFRIGTAATTGT